MFTIRKSELTDSATDYTLMNTCHDMLRQYCPTDTDHQAALHCLKLYKDEQLFDSKCHFVVVQRMIEQNLDYRFNPELHTACASNIAEYCTSVVAASKPNEELNGQVVHCLKGQFRRGKLTKGCEAQMVAVLHDQALNYRLDPLLQELCKAEIKQLCPPPSNGDDDHGQVEECLKVAFLSKKIISRECKLEVAQLIQESKADIHVDALLLRACTVDLLKYCSKVESGNGRRTLIMMRCCVFNVNLMTFLFAYL